MTYGVVRAFQVIENTFLCSPEKAGVGGSTPSLATTYEPVRHRWAPQLTKKRGPNLPDFCFKAVNELVNLCILSLHTSVSNLAQQFRSLVDLGDDPLVPRTIDTQSLHLGN